MQDEKSIMLALMRDRTKATLEDAEQALREIRETQRRVEARLAA